MYATLTSCDTDKFQGSQLSPIVIDIPLIIVAERNQTPMIKGILLYPIFNLR